MKETHPKFITGGTYTSNPTQYLKNGYSTLKKEDSLYEIISSTMSELNIKINNNKSLINIFLIFIPIIILSTIIYLKRNKVINFFKKVIYNK